MRETVKFRADISSRRNLQNCSYTKSRIRLGISHVEVIFGFFETFDFSINSEQKEDFLLYLKSQDISLSICTKTIGQGHRRAVEWYNDADDKITRTTTSVQDPNDNERNRKISIKSSL